MRRVFLAGLFVVSLFAMLCIGFALGAIFAPSLGRIGQVFNRSRVERLVIPRSPVEPPQNRGQLPAVPPDFSFGPDTMHPGALIREVVTGSPADTAGLKTGQMIQAVDGEKLDGSKNLADMVAAHQPGDTITLTIFSPSSGANATQEVKVKLGENPDKAGAAWLGIRYAPINIDVQPQKLPGG